LDRVEAVALLKQMITLGLILPSFVSVEKNSNNGFNLVLKSEGDLLEVRAFLSNKNLVLFEDKEKGTFTIYSS
jgi:hypothetical protein